MPDRISRIHHGNALGQQKRCQEISLLPSAQRLDVGIIRRTLYPAIPATVIVVSVPVVLAIGFVVFLVVTHQIGQREAIMGGNKINAGIGTAAAVSV